MFPRHNKLTICYLTACIAAASCTAVAANDDIAIDEHIEVRSKVQQRAFPTLPEARDELRKIAGGINLVELDKLPARQATLQDALGFEPGVMMQSFFGGNDQPRLNIRGSGVQSNPVNRGVQLLYDGLPINASDGSFVIGFLDPKSANMISVYRGANGLRYGATTLGGAINMMARNGTNSQSAIRAEYGSDNRLGASLQLAGQEKTWDYFLSAGSDSYDGYRHHSESERSNFSGNFGYAFSNNIYNRTYINYSDNTFEIPFVVPKARALADPKLVMGDGDTPMDILLNVYQRDPHRDSQQMRLANKTRISNGNSLQEIGLFYQQVDDTFTAPLKHNVTDSQDYGLEYAFMTSGDYVSQEDDFLVSLSVNRSDMDRDYYANNPQNGDRMQRLGSQELTANNAILALQWQAELSQHWQLVTAAQWVSSNRDIKDNTLTTPGQDKHYTSLNPKLGINYHFSQDSRLFANISSTAEAPTFWELVSTNVSPKNPQVASVKINDLDKQKATTIEVGGTGRYQGLDWNLAIYRSDVDDELISVVSDFAVNGQTENYQAGTVHQGVELELLADIASDFIIDGATLGAKLVYNYSDFYFDGGKYGGKQIAGIPEHLIQAELQFSTDNGFYLAPNIRWQPDQAPVDHANSQYQDDYLLVGVKAAYQVNNDLRIYLEGENLTDETYQTSYVIRGFSSEQQPTFLPGFGPSFTLGMNFRF